MCVLYVCVPEGLRWLCELDWWVGSEPFHSFGVRCASPSRFSIMFVYQTYARQFPELLTTGVLSALLR